MHEIEWSIVRTAAPGQFVSAAALKSHMRVDFADDDILIQGLGAAAESAVEDELGRALLTQTWELRLDRFPRWAIHIPRPPLQSVTSIQYVDNDGVTQTVDAADYIVDTSGEPGRITPAYGESWPTTRDQVNAVTVTYKAGVAQVTDVDDMIELAVKMTAADLYENRERSAPEAVRQLVLYERLMANHRTYHEFIYR